MRTFLNLTALLLTGLGLFGLIQGEMMALPYVFIGPVLYLNVDKILEA